MPSWSWVGWSGRVEYSKQLSAIQNIQRGRVLQYLIKDSDGMLLASIQTTPSLYRTRLIPEKSQFLIVEAPVIRLLFNNNHLRTGFMTAHLALASQFGIVGHATFFGRMSTETELSRRVTIEPWGSMFVLGCSDLQFRTAH